MKSNDDEKDLYSGISLRREHVENDRLPSIRIFCREEDLKQAEYASYGMEEEGLPFKVRVDVEPFAAALEDTKRKGLGVAIGIEDNRAQLYCRQFKKDEAFMESESLERDVLKILGKNAARIIKHKPFIMED